jgi:ATP:ADP antiporter, AAA family
VALPKLAGRLARRLDLEPGEGKLLLLMGSLVASLLGFYTIAKVLRDSMFISEYGALALPYGYIAVALASLGYIWLEPRITRRFSRGAADAFSQLVAIACSAAAALLFPLEKHWLAAAFYVWTGSQAMMLLSHFWVLALDVWDSRRARVLFPLLTGCGLLGGVAGGAFASWMQPRVGLGGLLWTVFALLVIARLITLAFEGRRPPSPFLAQGGAGRSRMNLLLRSPYLRLLATALFLSVVVATLVDFQFKYLAQQAYPDRDSLTRFLAAFYTGLNSLALVVQFGAAGWILRRVGLGPSTGLQPAAVLIFAGWSFLVPFWGVALAMRWAQGVIFQTLGKSSAEIYFTAVRPPERRQIKPALDTLVERMADALVGALLLVSLHTLGVGMRVIAGATALLATLWIFVLIRLHRQYVRAFRKILAARWTEPRMAADSLCIPGARKALVEALQAKDEAQVLLALRLSWEARHPQIHRAILDCLVHPSPRVRAAAVAAMDAGGVADREGCVERFLDDPNEELRRAAVVFLLSRGPEPGALARRLLDGSDSSLRQYAFDALVEQPGLARGALSLERVDRRIESNDPAQLVDAARALSVLDGPGTSERLRLLLDHPAHEVREAALRAVARRSAPEFLDQALALVRDPRLERAGSDAVATFGDRALPGLEPLVAGQLGERLQEIGAKILARIGTRRAVSRLVRLARSANPAERYYAFRCLNRVRRQKRRRVIPRSLAHRMFLRELRDYRADLEPALRIGDSPVPELKLLADSYQESADRALERACRALGCCYDPTPLRGVYEGLKAPEVREASARALEHLSHLVPRRVFRPARAVFEDKEIHEATRDAPTAADLAGRVRQAWGSGDAWLRACAVLAGRALDPFDLSLFKAGDNEHPLVLAELEALAGAESGPRRRSGRDPRQEP